MTIAEEISALRERISQAYDVIDQKGGDVPFDRTSWNLSASIDSIRTGGDPEDVNGISSLYAVQPELVWCDGEEGDYRWQLSGTQRKGPYNLDYSNLTIISSGLQIIGYTAAIYGAWDLDLNSYRAPTYAYPKHIDWWKNKAPNISSINLGNLSSIAYPYAAGGMSRINGNMLSVNIENLKTANAAYALQRAFEGTMLACDMPNLEQAGGNYALANAWENCDPNYNPLSAQMQERFLPKLSLVSGDYTMSYTFYNYKPMPGHDHLNLSALDIVQNNGSYTFNYAFGLSKFKKITLGLTGLKRAANYYYMNRCCYGCSELTAFEMPNLSAISSFIVFEYSFENCPKLSSLEFPALKTINSQNCFRHLVQNSPNFRELKFPELTSIQNNSNTFYQIFNNAANIGNRDIAISCYFPKLTSLQRGNNSSNIFANMNNDGTATRRRPYKMYFDTLPSVVGGTAAANALFYNSRSLTEVYFNSLSAITNTYLFSGCAELTAIHFSADNETAIKATSGYSTLWGRGAGAATVYFDL